MLQWIAETEAEGADRTGGGGGGGGSKKMRCPACNARIRTTEPHDPLVALGDRASRLYRRASPFFLMSILSTMGIAGSSYYGVQSLLAFAGTRQTLAWLGVRRGTAAGAPAAFLRVDDAVAALAKLFLLNMLLPGLLLQRALPSLANLIALPASVIVSPLFFLRCERLPSPDYQYASTLVARNRLPRWPPSPAWVIAAMPTISITYASIYYDLFGPLERRLNHAMRGRPVVEDADGQPQAAQPQQAPGNGDVPAAQAQGNQQQQQQQEPQELQEPHEPHGVGAVLRHVGTALANILRNNHDLVIENVGNGQDLDIQVEIIVEEVPDGEEGDVAAAADGAVQVVDDGDAAVPPDIARARPQPENAADIADADAAPLVNGDGNAANFVAEANRAGGITFTDVLTALATTLLLPRIAATAGEALGAVLPRAWTAPTSSAAGARGRQPTGLLQERWGRSLVGGAVFIVLRDAWALYAKYRRVQVKRQRRIKNVDRRRGRKSQ